MSRSAVGRFLTAPYRRFASRASGPLARYRRLAAEALAEPAATHPGAALAEEDLAGLPDAVARYVRRTGAVGLPRVTAFRAALSGRIRSTARGPWMPFTGEQISIYGPSPVRLFFLDARVHGLPLDVLHVMRQGRATMTGDLLSFLRVVNGSGPEMDRSETVTLFNDLVCFAPAALPFAPITWATLDDGAVRATYASGGQSVSAVLTFRPDGDLADFVTDDRLRADERGSTFTPTRWSTPVASYGELRGRRAMTSGSAVWHAPEGPFTYIELSITDIDLNPALEA